jgi:hypothetical protein
MMLGPFQSGKVQVVLGMVAVLAMGLAAAVPLTIVMLRPRRWWADLLAVALWFVALPCAGLTFLIGGLVYDTEPETHTFTVDDGEYLIASQVGFLGPGNELHLRLYRKDGHLYRRVGPRLMATADTDTFNREGFTLRRRGGDVWIVYLGSDRETERVRLPGGLARSD